MHPTEVRDEVVAHYTPQTDDYQVVTFVAPTGHEDDTGPAQGIVLRGIPGQAYGQQISLPLKLSDAEVDDIQFGQTVWLTFATDHVVPFAVTVGPIPPVI